MQWLASLQPVPDLQTSWFQPAVIAAVVALLSSIVTTVITIWFKDFLVVKSLLRDKLTTEYEYDQRKKLRELIGSYHGRVLLSADSLSRRTKNLLDSNEAKKWRKADGGYNQPENYYFRTTVYRFLELYTYAHRFETQALFIDSRIADEQDFLFMQYVETFLRIAGDTHLYDDLDYDERESREHILIDNLREVCESCWQGEDFATIEGFRTMLRRTPGTSLRSVLEFLEGLGTDERPLRYDRMVSLHLLLMAFINTFGYEYQVYKDEAFDKAVSQIQETKVLDNLNKWIGDMGLVKDEMKRGLGTINVDWVRRGPPVRDGAAQLRRAIERSGKLTVPKEGPNEKRAEY